jgi:integrase
MPKFPKPFFRRDRGTDRGWFVQIGRRQIKLADGPENQDTQAAAYKRYHEVMAWSGAQSAAVPAQTNSLAVAEVFEKYLDWCEKHRSPRTFEWYRGRIQNFIDFLPDPARMPASALRPFHIVEWTDGKTTWGANQKRGAIVAVTRPFNWATRIGYIDVSPVRGVEKPTAQKRDSQLTPEDFVDLIALVKENDSFRDLLAFSWECGCRPQEARSIEARHVRLENHRIEIPPKEAKGKQRWRIIYLSEQAEAIIRGLVDQYPSGPLFRNSHGDPWTVDAVGCRFGRLKAKLGTRFAAYDFRHAFSTRKLKEGHDPITVAGLLGHKDAAMLCKHYEGISGDGDHLLKAVTTSPM